MTVPLPPAILLGGAAGNALSVARSLGRHGVTVHLLCGPDSLDGYSRYARKIDTPWRPSIQDSWAEYLLGPASDHLEGAVLLACSDAGIETLMEHRDELAGRFILDLCNPAAQGTLLDKLATYRAAQAAGITAPRFWPATCAEEVHANRRDYVYPLLVKPLFSHSFQAVFHAKYFRARDLEEVVDAYERAAAGGEKVLLLEEIPGSDDQLCSYYTYIDADGTPLIDFTKRVIRRFPEGQGLGCYHVTDRLPDLRELGLRLFHSVGLVGIGNVEFKRDARDGKLKLIECNARFTAANRLLAASAYDLGLFVYNRLVGRPQVPLAPWAYRTGLHMWSPIDDARAFIALRASGRLTASAWLSGLAHRQVLPLFAWSDPLPSLVASTRLARRVVARGSFKLREKRPGGAGQSKGVTE